MNINKIKISGTQYDGRSTLSPLEKQLALACWNTGTWTISKIAKKFQVGKGTISRLIGRPQKVRAKASYRFDPTNKARVQKTREKKKLLFNTLNG